MFSEPPDPNWPRLLGLAAHELRNRISVGTGYLRMLITSSDAGLTDRQRQFVTESQKAWARMAALADEMSILSQLEAGTYRIGRQPVAIRGLLQEVIEALPSSADGPAEVRLAAGAEVTAQGDAARLRIALTSVLVALRKEVVTSPELLVLAAERDLAGKPVCWMAISDADHVGALAAAGPEGLTTFDEWRGGSGLKLAVARRVIGAHGGAMFSAADGTTMGAVIVLPR
ncbi:MAG: histidine kinase dimerization/phospho-acceptor domain-containing protein [Acidobacteriota bacterium]